MDINVITRFPRKIILSVRVTDKLLASGMGLPSVVSAIVFV